MTAPLHRTIRALCALALPAAAALLASCASAPQPADYAAERPVLSLRQYFNGPLLAHGLFTDRAGKVVKRFTVRLEGRWQGNAGDLQEDFVYSDGTTQQRIWHIVETAPGRYTGTAPDVVGEAQGIASGNALNWHYTLRLPVDGKVYEVQFDDWMYLVSEQVMINKARMSKFGFDLGEVTLSFQKP